MRAIRKSVWKIARARPDDEREHLSIYCLLPRSRARTRARAVRGCYCVPDRRYLAASMPQQRKLPPCITPLITWRSTTAAGHSCRSDERATPKLPTRELSSAFVCACVCMYVCVCVCGRFLRASREHIVFNAVAMRQRRQSRRLRPRQ